MDRIAPYTILLVDDSLSDRSIYRRWLTRNKPGEEIYKLVEFETGEEGLHFCQEQMPDLFLIDYLLPDMTGLEFLQQLQLQLQLQQEKIPAIVLTSQGSTEIAVELLKNGAEDYLDKNQITEDSLRRAIANIIKHFRLVKKLTQAEKESEEGRFWRQVLDNLVTFVGVLSPDGILLEANQAPLRAVGVKKPDVIGKPFAEGAWWQHSPEIPLRIQAAIAQAKAGEKVRFDLPLQTWDGTLMEMDLFFNPLFDVQGRTTYIIVSGTDITERKKAESEIKKVTERLNLSLTSGAIGCWEWNIPQNIIFWDERMYELYGVKKEPDSLIVYDIWANGVHPDDRVATETLLQKAVLGEAEYNTEFRVLHPDGSVHFIKAYGTPVYDSQGTAQSMIGINFDISNQKKAEIALQKQALVFESISDGVIVTDMDGIIIDWNHGSERIFGYSKTEILGKKPNILHPPELGMTLATEVVGETIRQGSWSGELPILRKDGSEGITETVTVVCHDPQGKAISIIGVNRDVTGRKQAEKIAKQQLQQEKLLFNVSQAIRQSFEINNILVTATREVKEVLQVDRAGIYRFNADWSGEFVVEAVDDHWTKLVGTDNPIIWTDTYLQEHQGGRFANHESFVTPDIYLAGLQPCHIEILEAFQAAAYIVSPIFSGDSLWGLLAVYDNTAPRYWESWEIELLERIANQLAIAIQQSEIYQQLQTELQERQKIEENLHQSKEQFELAITASQDGFWDWNLVTDEIYYSPRWKEMFGYTDQELPNALDTWGSLIFEEDYLAALQLVEDYNTGKVNQFLTTQRFHHKDGSTVYLISSAIHLKNSQGEVIRMIGSHSDITEMMKIQNEMETSKQYLQVVTEQLAVKLEELEQRNREMLVLGEMNDFLQSCISVKEACNAVGTFTLKLLPAFSGGISILNNSRNYLEMITTWGKICCSKEIFSPKDCWGLRRGKAHHITASYQKLLCHHFESSEQSIESLCIPLIAQGETLGLLYFYSLDTKSLSESQQQLARTIAEQTSAAIANLLLREKLQAQSIRDPLTGLFNRRYLEEYLTQEIHRARRNNNEIGIIMIDLDHFKRFNDTLGHDAGDFILIEVSKLLKETIRSSDTACRYGGEEMTIIMPESSLEATATKAEEIRMAIAHVTLNYNEQNNITLTSSFGVASFPLGGTTVKAVIQSADMALLEAKNAGRNRVVISGQL